MCGFRLRNHQRPAFSIHRATAAGRLPRCRSDHPLNHAGQLLQGLRIVADQIGYRIFYLPQFFWRRIADNQLAIANFVAQPQRLERRIKQIGNIGFIEPNLDRYEGRLPQRRQRVGIDRDRDRTQSAHECQKIGQRQAVAFESGYRVRQPGVYVDGPRLHSLQRAQIRSGRGVDCRRIGLFGRLGYRRHVDRRRWVRRRRSGRRHRRCRRRGRWIRGDRLVVRCGRLDDGNIMLRRRLGLVGHDRFRYRLVLGRWIGFRRFGRQCFGLCFVDRHSTGLLDLIRRRFAVAPMQHRPNGENQNAG